MENNFLNNPDQFPLVNKYFGTFLRMLVEHFESTPFEGRFILTASYTTMLEDRLSRIERLGLTNAIIKEVGNHKNPKDLDKRLLDAWAELRALDQLQVEGFSNIQKVTETADFYAQQNGQQYAIQVTRNNSKLESSDVFGATIDELHERFDDLLWNFFWDRLFEKNGNFKKLHEDGIIRVIVIVTSDETLQDPMVRHFACQQIRNLIFDPAFVQINFEELYWLPDLGHGAWFKLGGSPKETHCFADWHDEFGRDWDGSVYRREVDLDSPINHWKE